MAQSGSISRIEIICTEVFIGELFTEKKIVRYKVCPVLRHLGTRKYNAFDDLILSGSSSNRVSQGFRSSPFAKGFLGLNQSERKKNPIWSFSIQRSANIDSFMHSSWRSSLGSGNIQSHACHFILMQSSLQVSSEIVLTCGEAEAEADGSH